MNFDRETWRKLYVSESPEHRLLSVMTRGVRDYLIRFAKDDGTLLPKTKNPGRDMATVLGAHPQESSEVEQIISVLISVGYLSHKRQRLFITRFEEAQARKTPAAKRALKYRESKNTSDVREQETNETEDAHERSRHGDPKREEEIRSEEIRGETIPLPPPPGASARGAFPIRPGWHPSADTVAALEMSGVPRWAEQIIRPRFVTHFATRQSEASTEAEWNQRYARWAVKDWQDPAKRPVKPIAAPLREPTDAELLAAGRQYQS